MRGYAIFFLGNKQPLAEERRVISSATPRNYAVTNHNYVLT